MRSRGAASRRMAAREMGASWFETPAMRAPHHEGCSIDQPAVERRQKTVVENLRRRRPLAELEIVGDLLDRLVEPRWIDAAEAIAADFGVEDVVAQDHTPALHLQIARAAVH